VPPQGASAPVVGRPYARYLADTLSSLDAMVTALVRSLSRGPAPLEWGAVATLRFVR